MVTVATVQRRSFLAGLVATASGLWLTEEPRRVYSFIRCTKRAPVLRLFEGATPSTADSAITRALLLSEIPLSSVNPNEWTGIDFSADRTGTIEFARLYGANGEPILDMPREALGLNTTHVVTGSEVRMRLTLDKRLQPLLV